jgi:hexaprenyl-diphosphate synthase
MLDYTVSGAELGKPAGADLELGLATAPLLFAWKERPELGRLIGRKFAGEGDVRNVSTFSSRVGRLSLMTFAGTRDSWTE